MNRSPEIFIDMLFSTIADDNSLSSGIKLTLLKLQTPVTNISCHDQTFFTNPNHPARKTFLLIARLCENQNQSDKLELHINNIISSLTSKPDIEISDFNTANRSLLSLFKLNEKTLQDDTGNEQIKHIITSEIQQIISGNKIDHKAQDIALKLWPILLVHRYTQYGHNSEQWNEAIQSYKNLIASIQPIKTDQQLQILTKKQDLLIRQFSHHLYDASIARSRIEQAIKSLGDLYLEHMRLYKQNQGGNNNIKNKHIAPSSPESGQKNKDLFFADYSEAELKLARLPRNISPGTWFDLYNGENHAAQRLKLSVIINKSARLVFVDHRGIKGTEKDAAIFADEISRGQSKAVEEKSSLTGKINHLFSKLSTTN